MMFNKVSYRRGVIEGVVLYTLGRLGALITPAIFPDWLYVAVPLLFLVFQYLLGPFWATRRIVSTRRERLSKRFWLLGPRMAAICLGIDIVISLTCGLSVNAFGGVQQGPTLWRVFFNCANHLSLLDFGFCQLKSAALLPSFFSLFFVCYPLAMGGFFLVSIPAGG